MMDVARELGFEPTFLAARREEGLAGEEAYGGHKVRRIGPYFPLLNGRAPFLYVRSVIGFNFALYRELMRERPRLVHCSDIETMPAGAIYKWRSGARLLYNIHDNLAQRYSVPAWAGAVLNLFEGLAVRLSSVALVPEAFRRDALPRWCRAKVAIIRNTPVDRGVAPPRGPFEPIRLFFGGWLDKGRGLQQLIDLVRENHDFELTLAGEGAPDIVDEVRSAPRVRYIGFVTHEEIMAETAKAHFVCALYDPARPINRYAASNKLAEALAVGRPVFVNSEMLITKSLEGYDCLIKLPYGEVRDKGAEKIRATMSEGTLAYRSKCAAARSAYEALYAWDVAHQAMIKGIIGV